MDHRFLIILLIFICVFAIILVIIKAIKNEKELNAIRSSIAASEIRKNQLDEYRIQLTEVREQMRQRLDDGIRDAALSREWDELRGETLSEIPIVDLVLHEKRILCNENGVDCEYRIQPVPQGILEERYWPSLLGNLLDNGVEAAVKCPEDNRWIRVSSAKRANQWTLKVQNSKLTSEHPLATGMATTKADKKNHGIGSRVIDKIVKEADGYIKRIDDKDSFTVFIALPAGE